MIVGLIDYGYIDNSAEVLLPANPFPMNGATTRGELPLSPTEMQRLATALKSDLVAIHHKRFGGLESEATVVLLLLIGMRSGINATPLLEMRRDCLSPHPFMPNLMLVRTFKRRGKGAQSTTLRQTDIRDQAAPISMDGVAVLRRALDMTQALVAEAPEAIKDRLWLYRSAERGQGNGQTLCLTMGPMATLTRAIVKRHALLADDGKPLRVTLGRLRKTMENRLWKLSNGDLLAVSAVMGHSPRLLITTTCDSMRVPKPRGRDSSARPCQRNFGGAYRCNTDRKLQRQFARSARAERWCDTLHGIHPLSGVPQLRHCWISR